MSAPVSEGGAGDGVGDRTTTKKGRIYSFTIIYKVSPAFANYYVLYLHLNF